MIQAPDRSLRRDVGCWLSGLIIVTLASWGRWLATGSLKVDENYPSEQVGMLLIVALLAGWALMVLGWKGFLARPVTHPRRLAYVGLVVAAFMLPMLSNDVFSLFAYASLAAHGYDVSTTASAMPLSVWFPWVGEVWQHSVCVYGPTTLLAVLPTALAGANPWLAIALLRVVWFIPLVLVMELSFRCLRDRPFFWTMVWLNPLWLMEGPGQLHPDLLGLVAVVAGVVLHRRGWSGSGFGLFSFALLGKFTFAFTGFWFWLFGTQNTKERMLRIPAMVAVLLGGGVLFFGFFWHGLGTVLEPIRTLARQNPSGSIIDFAGQVVNVLRGVPGPPSFLSLSQRMALDRASMGETWTMVSIVMKIVALGVGVRVLTRMLRKPYDEDAIALGTGALVVAALTLASHRFQSWYLLAAIPFFGLRCDAVWKRWWTLAVALTVSISFLQVLPPTAVLRPVWSTLNTLGIMVVFLMSFPERYLLTRGVTREVSPSKDAAKAC